MTSYTKHIRNQMQSTKFQIMKLLNWDETEYGQFQLKIGRQYLQSYIPNDPAGIDMLVDEKIFWNWWKNHWLQRDEDFIKEAYALVKRGPFDLKSYYLTFHQPDDLIRNIRPYGFILSESYKNMIGKLIESHLCPL